jgi:hypothetical protein
VLSEKPGATVIDGATDQYDIAFDLDIDFLRRLDRGELSALTAMGQARSSDWRVFGQVRGGLRTKAKLWDSVRSLFKVQLFPTMDALYRQIADLYDIQLC